jgi:hypothetical protein
LACCAFRDGIPTPSKTVNAKEKFKAVDLIDIF